MSLVYYRGSNQIPGTCDEPYKFEPPIYGESTTDPTYYEPTATRIANMKRSAGAFQGLYDFSGSVKDSEEGLNQLSGAVVDVRYSKHGMTKEEISQVTMEQFLKAENIISDKKKEKVDKSETLKNELEIAEAVSKKLESLSASSAKNTKQNNGSESE